jgi:hypothetical protein
MMRLSTIVSWRRSFPVRIRQRKQMRAVAFIIFNRPELTKGVFEKIRSAKSAILLVVADSGFLQRCRNWPDIRQIASCQTPLGRPQSAGRCLESRPRLRAAKVVGRRAGGGQLAKHSRDQETSMRYSSVIWHILLLKNAR